MTNRLNEAKLELKKAEEKFLTGHEAKGRLETINKILNNNKDELTILTSDILKAFIKKIISIGPNEIIFCLKSNNEYNDKYFSQNIDQFLSIPEITSGEFIDPIYMVEMKYKVIIA